MVHKNKTNISNYCSMRIINFGDSKLFFFLKKKIESRLENSADVLKIQERYFLPQSKINNFFFAIKNLCVFSKKKNISANEK